MANVTKVGNTIPATATGAATVSPVFAADMPRNPGNILIGRVYARGANPITATAGWTALLANDVIGKGGTTSRMNVFWAIAHGGDAAPTFSSTSANPMRATLEEFTNNDPVNPIIAASVAGFELDQGSYIFAVAGAPAVSGAMACTAYSQHANILAFVASEIPDTGWIQGPWNGGSSQTHFLGGDRQEGLSSGAIPQELIQFTNPNPGGSWVPPNMFKGALFSGALPGPPGKFERRLISSGAPIAIDTVMAIIFIIAPGQNSSFIPTSLFFRGRAQNPDAWRLQSFPRPPYAVTAPQGPVNLNLSATDSIPSLSEIALKNVSFSRTISDSLAGITDVVNRTTAFSRTALDDFSGLIDSVSRALSLVRTISDSLGGISDSVIRTPISLSRTVSDSLASLADSVSRLISLPRTTSDTLNAITETTVVQKGIARTVSDVLSAISDTAIRSSTAASRNANDSINAPSDSAIRVVQNFLRTASDTISAITESTFAQKGVSRTASDTLAAISDSAVRSSMILTRTASDTPNTLSDSAVRLSQNFSRTSSDILSVITESTLVQKGISRTASDVISAISDASARIFAHPRTASDPLVAITDLAIRSPQSFTRTAIDLLGSLIDSAIGAFSGLLRPLKDVEAITYSRDGIGQVYSRDGGVSFSQTGIGETISRDGGITYGRDGIGIVKER